MSRAREKYQKRERIRINNLVKSLCVPPLYHCKMCKNNIASKSFEEHLNSCGYKESFEMNKEEIINDFIKKRDEHFSYCEEKIIEILELGENTVVKVDFKSLKKAPCAICQVRKFFSNFCPLEQKNK